MLPAWEATANNHTPKKWTFCQPSPLRKSDMDDVSSSIGTVWRCQNVQRLEPQTFDIETQERRQVATVDGWQHCLLAKQRQLAVPAAHADPKSIAVFTWSYHLSLTSALIQSTRNTSILILTSDILLCYSATEHTKLMWGQTQTSSIFCNRTTCCGIGDVSLRFRHNFKNILR